MRPVVWTDTARDALLDIVRFIAADNPAAARKVAAKIDGTAENLAEFATGHPGRVSGTYEKAVAGFPYILVYSLCAVGEHKGIAILHVTHGARNWPDEEWPG